MTEVLTKTLTGDITSARIALLIDGYFLLGQRNEAKCRYNGGRWQLFGGKLEAGEMPLQAAQNEFGQEIGLQAIGAIIDLGLIENRPLPDDPRRTKRTHGFLATDYSGQMHLQYEECQAAGWFRPDEALALPLTIDTRNGILRAIEYTARLTA